MKGPPALSPKARYAGKTIIEHMEDNLLEATRRYLEMKAVPIPEEKLLWQQRGIVRGCAQQLAAWRNVYSRNSVRTIQLIEQEFVKKVKDANLLSR